MNKRGRPRKPRPIKFTASKYKNRKVKVTYYCPHCNNEILIKE